MTVQVLHTRPRGGRWSVEAQKKILLPASRQQAVEIITSGWVWETDVGLEMCWRHLWKRHRARLLKNMTQEIPSHNLCRWLIILGRLIVLWAILIFLRPSAGCWQSTQRGACSDWVSVVPHVFLGKRHRGSWEHLQAGLSPRALPEPHCSPEGHGLGRRRLFRKLT